MSTIHFTRNYHDLSTDKGFQFEFYCDRCGSGYRTTFQPSKSGLLGDALNTANGLFGGLFGKAADLTN